MGPSISLFAFNDSITSWNLTASLTSLFISIHTSNAFRYASNFISLLQLGTLAGFTNLLGLPLQTSHIFSFPLVIASVICFIPINISLLFCLLCISSLYFLYFSISSSYFLCLFSISSSYCFLIGSILSFNKLHAFHNSENSASPTFTVLAQFTLCKNSGYLHFSHPLLPFSHVPLL